MENTVQETKNNDVDEEQKIDNYLKSLKEKLKNSANEEKPKKEEIHPKPEAGRIVISEQLLNKIKSFVAQKKPKVYILTPCYGGLCHVNYIQCLMMTFNIFQELGINYNILFLKSESLIQRGRNNLIAKAMYDPDMTHAFFIDSDITWNPVDVLKLIAADEELIGGIYPLKRYMWENIMPDKISEIMKRHKLEYNKNIPEHEFLCQNLIKYNLNILPTEKRVVDNKLEIYTMATGFMMIKRSCIEKMMEKFPQSKYTDDCGYLKGDENKFAYALFDCGVVNDRYFSEDWLFCHRWREIGGHVYIDVTIDLYHTGQEDYKGRFLSTLEIS